MSSLHPITLPISICSDLACGLYGIAVGVISSDRRKQGHRTLKTE